jgi:uncharacterized membrane protein
MPNIFPPQLWEIHPILVHFPIAFLLGGVVLDLYGWWRSDARLVRFATSLLIVGVLADIPAAATGFVAYATVPAHTEAAHSVMLWHLGIQSAVLVAFAVVVALRWRIRQDNPGQKVRWLGVAAVLFLMIGSHLGGLMVYRGGAGVSPEILAPEIRMGHTHGEHHTESGEETTSEDHSHAH